MKESTPQKKHSPVSTYFSQNVLAVLGEEVVGTVESLEVSVSRDVALSVAFGVTAFPVSSRASTANKACSTEDRKTSRRKG